MFILHMHIFHIASYAPLKFCINFKEKLRIWCLWKKWRGMDKENRLCYVSCASCFMSFAKSFALIPRYSCHNFFKISSLIFYFSNFRGTLEADDVIGKEWELLSMLMYCWTGLLMQSMFSLQMLIVMKTVMDSLFKDTLNRCEI